MSEGLVLPVTFNDPRPQTSAGDYFASSSQFNDGCRVNTSCSQAKPTYLTSWGLGRDSTSKDPEGVAMGCEDGSIYIFRPKRNASRRPTTTSKLFVPQISLQATLSPRQAANSPPVSPGANHNGLPSPSPSTTSLTSMTTSKSVNGHGHPFSVVPRTRAVSDISKDQVEAPKVYVDYEEEEDKLRAMLKGGKGPVRDKGITEGWMPSFSRALNIQRFSGTDHDKTPSSESLVDEGDDEPSNSRPSPSPPPTPPGQASHLRAAAPIRHETIQVRPRAPLRNLGIAFHIFPPRFGDGHSVTSLSAVEEGKFLVCLQESGAVSVFSTIDGICAGFTRIDQCPRLQPPLGFKSLVSDERLWSWKSMFSERVGEDTIILLCAQPQLDPQSLEVEDDSTSETRVALFKLRNADNCEWESEQNSLEMLGEWIVDGPCGGVGMTLDNDNRLLFYRISSTHTLIQNTISVNPYISLSLSATLPPSRNNSSTTLPLTNHQIQISIPNPFKAKSSPKLDVPTELSNPIGRISLGESKVSGTLDMKEVVEGMELRKVEAKTEKLSFVGAVWSSERVLLFSTEHGVQTVALLDVAGVEDVSFIDDWTALGFTNDGANIWRFKKVDKDGTASYTMEPTRPIPGNISPIHTIIPSSDIVLSCTTSQTPDSSLQLQRTNFDRKDRIPRKTDAVWKCGSEDEVKSDKITVTSILPLELHDIIAGYSDGSLGRLSLMDLLGAQSTPRAPNLQDSLESPIVGLHKVTNLRTQQDFVFGTAEDGSVAVWDLGTLQLRARWTVFCTPASVIINLYQENVGRLKGCVLCVAEDGTIAVIILDDLKLLYLIPGASTSLERVCTNQDDLLLIYSDGRARLWDTKTHEFRRALDRNKAVEILRQNSWFEIPVDIPLQNFLDSTVGALGPVSPCVDAAHSLLLDLCDIVEKLPHSLQLRLPRKHSRNATDEQRMADFPFKYNVIRPVLSTLLTFGLDQEVDTMCVNDLGLSCEATIASGMTGYKGATSLFPSMTCREIWKISPVYTASRLLAIVTVLRACLIFDQLEQHVTFVLSFYVATLPDTIGPGYQAPSLPFLASRWFDSSAELKQAARVLFESSATRLSDKATIELVELWQHKLPSLQPDAERETQAAALSLVLTGHIAVEKYSLLSASTLTDIAKSIALYLHDEASAHRVIAIDLCSRGFQIWQHYVDAMEILRALFTLASSTSNETRLAAQEARLAVLQIASTNTPLFMTTLSLDITQPRSVEHRKATMQLVAFLIRKRPLVLYPNLPRLVEAVVKSLDPNSSAKREAVLDSAVEILGQVVQTFPSIDFHMQSQRLAVGTNEGAVIMYDLKTATRLYVLEGHKQRLAACSFSPDGRRLVTASLQESVVMVWKVGSSLSNFFTPGLPPRQGHSGSSPYKTLSFNVGNEAYMTVAASLEWVGFEWPAERTARLKIRDSVLTFST